MTDKNTKPGRLGILKKGLLLTLQKAKLGSNPEVPSVKLSSALLSPGIRTHKWYMTAHLHEDMHMLTKNTKNTYNGQQEYIFSILKYFITFQVRHEERDKAFVKEETKS